MHYRVSNYNYFAKRFKDYNCDFIVRTNELQKQNTHPINFDLKEIPFQFTKYRKEIELIKPSMVILFLHLKDVIIWPLIHWLKMKKIPVVFWSKGINLDDPDNKLRYRFFSYIHKISDGLILYSENEIHYIKNKYRRKIFVANNTVNFEDYPEIKESVKQIKNEFSISYKKVVLSVGRMGAAGERKKVHHLIEIFNDIDLDGIGLVIVGSGMSQELLNKLNRKNTMYLGEVHDPHHIQISKIFKMADIFSIPGHVGLGLNQAFYWGLPVITEEGFQPPEIYYLINGRNGFIVPNNDVNELRRKLMYLLDNDDVRREFSENAREDIMKNASIENMFMGFKNCVDSLLRAI
jgi:glycosyltransferase involved in cell wall biosynthesis